MLAGIFHDALIISRTDFVFWRLNHNQLTLFLVLLLRLWSLMLVPCAVGAIRQTGHPSGQHDAEDVHKRCFVAGVEAAVRASVAALSHRGGSDGAGSRR